MTPVPTPHDTKNNVLMRKVSFWLLMLVATLPLLPAQAQVQRSFLNLSFEDPNLQTPGCRVYIAASQVPGWNTTHPGTATENTGGCVVPPGFTQTAPILEIWRTPRNNSSGGAVNARSGTQIAELNAALSSRIFQNVCLINGEGINWRFSHRGRSSATVRDQAEMKIGAASGIVRVGTTNNGIYDPPVALQGTVDPPLNAPGNATWVDYRGRFNYAGSTGTTNIGFESVGGTTSGNLLDDIQIELAPFVEFTQPSSSTPEASTLNVPTLRVNGTAVTSFDVTVQITGGTATLGTDFTTPGNSPVMTVNVPAGTYDGISSGLFALPITIVQDAEVEGNETIELQVQPAAVSPAPYLLASSSSCGAAAQTTWIYTIVDDDSSINLTKNAANPVAVAGQPTQFDVAYTLLVNNPTGLSANYSLVDTPGLEGDVSIVSASYSLNGGALTTLTGVGPWTLQPQWRALAGGATDTYVLTVRININRGGSVGNDACATPTTPGAGLHNSASAELQGALPGSNIFEATACRNTPTPVWVTLRKQLVGRAIANDQVQVRLLSAGTLSASATTTGNSSPATVSTGVTVLQAGNTTQFEEAVKTNGTGADRTPLNYDTQLACTNANAASTTILPSGTGIALSTRQQWPEFTPAGGDDLDCVITNTPVTASLSITKSNAVSSVPSGGTVNYTIVVSNAGPAAANGAVVRDPVVAGLNCTAATCGTEVNGATCPVATGPALASALQSGAGAVVSVLPANGALTFTLNCAVTATGLP